MSERFTLTVEWYQRKQILRCLSFVQDGGIDRELFFSCIGDQLQAEARKMLREKKYLHQNGTKISLSSPLLSSMFRSSKYQVTDFLSNLYLVLEDAIEQHQKPRLPCLSEQAKNILTMATFLQPKDDLSELEQHVLDHYSPLIDQLRLPRIGGLDHLADELFHGYNALSVVYFRHFGDPRMDSLRRFHQDKGQDICTIFRSAMDSGSLPTTVHENMLRIMIQYYDLCECMYDQMLSAAKQLLVLQEARSASPDDLAETHMALSNAYLGAHKSVAHWMDLSEYHLEKSFEYNRISYEEYERSINPSLKEVSPNDQSTPRQ